MLFTVSLISIVNSSVVYKAIEAINDKRSKIARGWIKSTWNPSAVSLIIGIPVLQWLINQHQGEQSLSRHCFVWQVEDGLVVVAGCDRF